MKICPQCGSQYSDATLSYCLQDGTPLIGEQPADTPTVILGEEETVVPRREAIRVPVEGPSSPRAGQSQATRAAQPVTAAKKGSNTALAVALTAIGMLVIFGLIGVAAIVFLRNSQQATVQNLNAAPNGNTGGPKTNLNSPPRPSPSPTETLPPATPRTVPQPPQVPSSYPSTTRLKFGRGAYSTSFSGDINPSDSRSLVLSCRSGQSLTATISGSSCVSIRGGGTSFRTTTKGGDNYLTLVSTCPAVAHFTITISVL